MAAVPLRKLEGVRFGQDSEPCGGLTVLLATCAAQAHECSVGSRVLVPLRPECCSVASAPRVVDAAEAPAGQGTPPAQRPVAAPLNQPSRLILYKRDVHYLVSPHGKVLIIDELMGRVLVWRRWSHGLHQAVDAKENLNIQEGSRTVATPSSARSVCWAGLPLSGRREAPRGNGLRTRAAVLRALDVS